MDGLELDLVGLLYKLLPGLVAASVFHSITPYPRRDVFDRVANALVFTAIGQILMSLFRPVAISIGTNWFSMGPWTEETSLFAATLFAVFFCILLAFLLNTDRLHKILRERNITKRVSLPSQWYSAFTHYERYVVLILKNGNRLFGWPKEWPDSPDSGHFIIIEPAWLLDDGSQVEVQDIEIVLIASSDVESVEFMRFSDDKVCTANYEQIEFNRQKLISIQSTGDQNGKQGSE